MMNLKTCFYLFCAAALTLSTGCLSTQPGVTVRRGGESPRMVTLGLDARDYDEVTRELYESIANSSKVDARKVLALGAVTLGPSVEDGMVDVVTLQEKLQTHVLRAGLFQFSMSSKPRVARDDMAGNVAFREAMAARKFYYEQKQIDNEEDDMVWGGIVPPDYLIFGRFSMDQQSKGRRKEVTYRFNYKIGDCRTGLIIWTDEAQYSKAN